MLCSLARIPLLKGRVSFLALEPLHKALGSGSSSFLQNLSSGQAFLWLLPVSSSSYGWMTKPSIEGET